MSGKIRGISPELLVSQVKNTMPYLFDPQVEGSPLEQFVPVIILRKLASTFLDELPNKQVQKVPQSRKESHKDSLDHFQYFQLCLSAHYLTCATPVPTDVDNQIRKKLWSSDLSATNLLQMSQWVLDSRNWDFTPVSSRTVFGLRSSPSGQVEKISGHLGEWFSVAAAAYCALTRVNEPLLRKMRGDILEQIADEVRQHSEIFGCLWREGAGLACLRAAALISHNLGDLSRVMDQWELSPSDPLRIDFYQLTASPFGSDGKLRYQGRLWVAGQLYQAEIQGSSMALENHRHFSLRKPRCLRQRREYLIPLGPFLDDWGRTVAKGLVDVYGGLSEDCFEVIGALKLGLERMPQSLGYIRALRGMLDVHPGLKVASVGVPRMRELLEVEQKQFESIWNEESLKLMDDIPSRA